MILHLIYWYVIISYLVGGLIFLVEQARNWDAHLHAKLLRQRRPIRTLHLVIIGLVAFLLSPIMTWHGILHYAAWGWSKLNHKPFVPWI